MQLIAQPRYFSKRMIDCRIFGLLEKYKMGLLLFNSKWATHQDHTVQITLMNKVYVFIKYIYFYCRCSFLYIFRKDMFPFSIFKGWPDFVDSLLDCHLYKGETCSSVTYTVPLIPPPHTASIVGYKYRARKWYFQNQALSPVSVYLL
jgi:hypothetical protein